MIIKKDMDFIPALKFNLLTHFFDPLMRLIRWDIRFGKALLLQANIEDNDIVLDFGCGTGMLAILAKKKKPKSTIHGIDVDPNILRIAKSKLENSDYEVFLNVYDGTLLPYGNNMFDKVISSLVFHHLTTSKKTVILKEIYRVLKFGGRLHILDFGKARSLFMRGAFLPVQLLDGFPNTSANIKGLLPEIIQNAGFHDVIEHRQITTLLGPISFYEATKPK